MKRRTFLASLFAVLGAPVASLTATAQPNRHTTERGYGPCKHRSCDCYKFDGKSNTCKCGHSFYDHR